jgi:tRNA(Ile2) C34 agmatinyltransferase TiaS
MAFIIIDYKCPKCGEKIEVPVETYYSYDIPTCEECGTRMQETGRTEEIPEE